MLLSEFVALDNRLTCDMVHGCRHISQPPVSGGTRLGLVAAFLAVAAVSFSLPQDMQVKSG